MENVNNFKSSEDLKLEIGKLNQERNRLIDNHNIISNEIELIKNKENYNPKSLLGLENSKIKIENDIENIDNQIKPLNTQLQNAKIKESSNRLEKSKAVGEKGFNIGKSQVREFGKAIAKGLNTKGPQNQFSGFNINLTAPKNIQQNELKSVLYDGKRKVNDDFLTQRFHNRIQTDKRFSTQGYKSMNKPKLNGVNYYSSQFSNRVNSNETSSTLRPTNLNSINKVKNLQFNKPNSNPLMKFGINSGRLIKFKASNFKKGSNYLKRNN